MKIDVQLKPRDGARGTYDVQLNRVTSKSVIARVRPAANSHGVYDVFVYPYSRVSVDTVITGFPTQFAGLKYYKGGTAYELCLVATADAPTGMGGQVRVNKNGTTYAIYLVETSDGNASPIRIQTSAGTKSLRLKT